MATGSDCAIHRACLLIQCTLCFPGDLNLQNPFLPPSPLSPQCLANSTSEARINMCVIMPCRSGLPFTESLSSMATRVRCLIQLQFSTTYTHTAPTYTSSFNELCVQPSMFNGQWLCCMSLCGSLLTANLIQIAFICCLAQYIPVWIEMRCLSYSWQGHELNSFCRAVRFIYWHIGI